MEDRWLSVEDIAAYLGIKRDTVQDLGGEQNRERPMVEVTLS